MGGNQSACLSLQYGHIESIYLEIVCAFFHKLLKYSFELADHI
jgi:hypothetical protein